MTCRDCFCYNRCSGFIPSDLNKDVFDYCAKGKTDEIPDIEERCVDFKNKADFVEVETIKSWLYSIAINNVGCVGDGDFSTACKEIISRLDGLKRFAQERRDT